ncbi:MAG: class II aldolase/adducin family protein [Acidobacteriota bacterium]|nr:class II aldolase/adducin family protein [Acidobacteriota bacterium]
MDAREEVWTYARKMNAAGLVTGSSGNVSRRTEDHRIAITPSGISYDNMSADEIVYVDLESGKAVDSTREPSYELPLHLAIYRSRPAVQAIVHTHAPFVTTLSVLHRPLPPVIDEMLVYLGGTIEVADYAFTGTDALGVNVVRKLGDRTAVLLANHGNVCIGRDLAQALHVAQIMEAGARAYVQALQIGNPVPLPQSAIAAGHRLFEHKSRIP